MPRRTKIRRKPRAAGQPEAARQSKVARWGNSLAFRLPQDVVEELRLSDGAQVSVEVRSGALVVRPVRKRWSEQELLEGVTPGVVGGEIDWGDPVGKEV
jgi:antitoxin MazE